MPEDLETLNRDRRRAYELLRQKRYEAALEIFLKIFDGTEPAVANCVGRIYASKSFPGFNLESAKRYFSISATSDDPYGLYYLGRICRSQGQMDEAVQLYKRASDAGNHEAAYGLYLYYRKTNLSTAMRYLDKAAAAGNEFPPAITTKAILSMEGRYGWKNIPAGIVSYVKNIPRLIEFTRNNV
jgi:tetratricopeptide (TPR) repeat protein